MGNTESSIKVRETSFVLICFMIGKLLSEVIGRVGHGLVLAWFELCVLPGLFRQFFTIARTRETLWYILFIPLRTVVCEIQLSVQTWSKR